MQKIEIIEIFTCQGGVCFYCHRPMSWSPGSYATSYTRDHFYPKAKGYKLNRNTVLAHEKCNYDKKDRLPNKIEVKQFQKLYKKIDSRAEKIRKMKEGNKGQRKPVAEKKPAKGFGRW